MPKQTKSGPSPEMKERLARCRRGMKRLGAGALLVTNPVDFIYLTGFTGDESAVMVTARDVHLISDGRFEEQIKTECPWAKTYMRRGMLNAEIATACGDLKIKKLAVQADHLSLGNYREINRFAKGTRVVAGPPMVAAMRRIKSKGEVTAMRKAIRVAEDAFVAMRKAIRVGQTELEMAGRLEYEMKARGASQPSFPTICAVGANGALPHSHPGTRKVNRGSAILFDWGARVGGYCSDLTRMVFVGTIPRKIEEISRVVLASQRAGIAAIRPGKKMCDVDAVARKVVEDAGFGREFNHGLGHGLGLDVHEAPSLSWRSKEKLEPGMLVTVEPGIYLPGVGGVRIEDDVLVTPTGHRVLSRLGKSLKDAVI